MKRTTGRQYEALATKSVVMTPGKFLALTAGERSNIESTAIVVPKLGGRGFGGIRVTFRDPLYQVAKLGKVG